MSGERHGAIRIGRPDEYRWVGRFFAAFGMEPHNYYDLTKLGAKSQPIIATAFRARRNPEHRIFCSLLMTDYFAPATRGRLEAQLATREIFSAQAKALIEQHEQAGGLTAAEATQLIQEGVQRIFKWTGRARNYGLYQDLCAAGFKIAADVVCFESHHLNHLTPNTLWLDLYTAAMRHCLGELSAADFRARAAVVLARVAARADHDYLRLHFRHLADEEIAEWQSRVVPAATLAEQLDVLGIEADLFLEFAAGGFDRRLATIDAALRHLPGVGCSCAKPDEYAAVGRDQHQPDVRPVEFGASGHHGRSCAGWTARRVMQL